MSHRTGDNWTDWSTPQNLGNSVNSAYDESYFSIDPDKRQAHFVSENRGNSPNIYRISLMPDDTYSEPESLISLYGVVSDQASGKPAPSKIIFHDHERHRQYIAYSDPTNGHYFVMVPKREKFKATIKADGYFLYTETIALSSNDSSSEFMQNFSLYPLEKGMVIPLHSIYFERGNSRVLKKSYPYLEDLVYYLQDNPELKIELLGHTDSQGSHKSSRQLSEERVGRIQHFLKNNNIHPHRIKAKGYGEMRPVAPNDSEENRAKNRRVEIRILDL